MKLFNLLFISSTILGTLVAISSFSWLSMWIGLEINLLSIIPLMSSSKNLFSSESALKYFITQAMASMILLMTAVFMMTLEEFMTPLVNSSMILSLNSALLMKLGAAPFHFWFPEVIEGLSWLNSFILLTWQKIAPMILLMNNSIPTNFTISIIIFSLVVSTISGFNQTSIRKILAYSSINHIAWMLSTLLTAMSLWMIYFSVYLILNLNIIVIFNYYKTFFLNQLVLLMKNKLVKMTFLLNFLSLGGLPPFIGFFPKWLIVNWLNQNNLFLISFILIVFSLIMLFIYIRMILPSMTLSSSNLKTFQMNKFTFSILNLWTLMTLPVCTILFNYF